MTNPGKSEEFKKNSFMVKWKFLVYRNFKGERQSIRSIHVVIILNSIQ